MAQTADYNGGREPAPKRPNPRAVPIPPGHETIYEMFAALMLAGYGPHWKWKCPAVLRWELQNAFYGGFQAKLGAIYGGLGDALAKEVVPVDQQRSFVHWQNELDEWRKNLARTHAEAHKRKRL